MTAKPKPRTKGKTHPDDRLTVPALTPGGWQAIAPNTRVRLKSGRVGTALAPAWKMPNHTLIELDGTGDRQWILTSLLEGCDPP